MIFSSFEDGKKNLFHEGSREKKCSQYQPEIAELLLLDDFLRRAAEKVVP